MRRISVSFLLFPILVTVGCGSNGGNPDMGAAKDLAMGDMAQAPIPDMTMAAVIPGKNIAPGKTFQFLGAPVTDDDFVVYFSGTTDLVATPLAGGMTQTIAQNAAALVNKKAVFAWANFDNGSMIGDLTVWTQAGGAVQVATNSVAVGVESSDDGQYVICNTNAAGDGSSADYILIKSDGTGSKTLWTGVATDSTNAPTIRFAGGKFFVAHTSVASDAGAAKTSVDVVATDGTITNLSPDATNFVANDKSGTKAMFADAQGNVTIVSTIGSPGTQVGTMMQNGFMLPDGSAGLITTTGGALQRVVGGSPAATLVATNANGFPVFGDEHSLTPDGKFVLYYNSQDPMSGVGDLSFSSTTAPNMTTVLTSKADGAIFGDPYTTDGSRVLYYTGVANGVGDFKSQDVSGGMATTHGTNVWVSYNTSKPKGAIFNDNWKAKSMTNGRADIEVIDDTSTTNAPTLIVAQAEADYYLSHDHSQLVFYYLATAGKEGIYVTPIP